MSARNGDKARFGKQRKRKMAHRARTRVLIASRPLTETAPKAETEQKPEMEQKPEAEQKPEVDHHSVLGSAAETIGSVLGSLAAKVKGSSSTTSAT